MGNPHFLKYHYNNQEIEKSARFLDGLKQSAQKNADSILRLDDVAAFDFMDSQRSDSHSDMPEPLQVILDGANNSEKKRITKAFLDGIQSYEKKHGTNIPADVVNQAIHSAYSCTDDARARFKLDSADSNRHDPLALQTNRVITSFLTTLSEAIPFAHYLPADIGSNEAKLAIISHKAGNDYGAYKIGGLLDGHFSGDAYISSSRFHSVKTTGAASVTGKITTQQDTDDTCDQTAPAPKLLRGRALVSINGVVCGKEMDASGTGDSPFNGRAEIAQQTYLISGKINPDTGEFTVQTTPALPTGMSVGVEAFVDYERQPELTPSIVSAVETYTLHAKPWRVNTSHTIDASTQMMNELSVDPMTESVMAIHTQFANERHYEVLRHAKRLAQNNQHDFNFDWPRRSTMMNGAQIWLDFFSTLAVANQQMAHDTMSHGISHIYVGKMLASHLSTLPTDVFQRSGLPNRDGIFRLGRLFDQYAVYYAPKVVEETKNAAQMLCIGRANEVARNPFILGDAVAPTVIPLAVGADLRRGTGFYARNFTAQNPHQPSARGCALINITQLR